MRNTAYISISLLADAIISLRLFGYEAARAADLAQASGLSPKVVRRIGRANSEQLAQAIYALLRSQAADKVDREECRDAIAKGVDYAVGQFAF